MPIGLIELAVAYAVVVDVLVRSRLPSEDQPVQLQRSKQDEDYVKKCEAYAA